MSKRSDTLPPDAAEFARIFDRSDKTQGEMAAYLSRLVGRPVANYQVSRWANGHLRVPVDIMDAMRSLEAGGGEAARGSAQIIPLTETGDLVPLFGYANAAGSVLRLTDEQRLGVVPIHPAQRGSRAAFAFLVFGDSLSPMLNHGDVAYAIRNRTPRKGQPCLIELKGGETLVKLFAGIDDRTLFAEQLTPKRDLTFALREVEAIHAVVGVSFG